MTGGPARERAPGGTTTGDTTVFGHVLTAPDLGPRAVDVIDPGHRPGQGVRLAQPQTGGPARHRRWGLVVVEPLLLYEVQGVIGRRSPGPVHQAHGTVQQRTVDLKTCAPEYALCWAHLLR